MNTIAGRNFGVCEWSTIKKMSKSTSTLEKDIIYEVTNVTCGNRINKKAAFINGCLYKS